MDTAKTKGTDMDNDKFARLARAFEIVSPAGDWRDAIDFRATHGDYDAAIAAAGVTHAEVLGAIRHYTATTPCASLINGRTVIKAAGYRAGPAGDH